MNNKKCLLIFPRMNKEGFWSPPLGVAYIASFLEKNNISVKISDMTFEFDWTLLENILKSFIPDIVAISIQTPMIKDALTAASIVKKYNSNIITVAGGPHVSCLPEETLTNPNIDIVNFGEGEYTLLELCKNIPLSDIKGIIYKSDNIQIRNPSREPIQNLDTLPFPAWHLLSPKYFETHEGSVLTTRGCPYNCSFCQPCQRLIFGNKIRRRSPTNVVNEIEILHKKYGIRFIRIQDDTFTSDLKWIEQFCEELKTRKLSIILDCKTRADTVNEETFEKMHKVGFYRIDIGVESGSERIRNNILNKNVSEETIISAFKILHKLKIASLAFFMIGTPTESCEDIQLSINLLKKIKPDSTVVSITTPFPQTKLYEYAVKHDLLIGDYSNFNFWYQTSLKTDIPEEEIYRLKKKIEKLCYMERLKQPHKFLNTILLLSGFYTNPKIALLRLTSPYLYIMQYRRYFTKLGKL